GFAQGTSSTFRIIPANSSTGTDGVFSPGSNTTLAARNGQAWNFITVTIPAGVRVTSDGNGLLDIRSKGAVTINGVLDDGGGFGGADGCVAGGGGGGGPGGGKPTGCGARANGGGLFVSGVAAIVAACAPYLGQDGFVASSGCTTIAGSGGGGGIGCDAASDLA